jgi:hypothetical protein
MENTSRGASAGGLPPGIDRRGFLRTTGGGAVAAAVAGWLTPVAAGAYAAPASPPEALSPKEHAVVVAAAEALLVGVPVPPARIADRLDAELAAVGDPVLADTKVALLLLEHGTILGGHLARFTRLEPEERLAYLAGWGRSRFNLRRAIYRAVKSFVHFYGYADDATRPLTGFDGPWPERVAIPAYPVDFGEVR